MTYRRKHDDRVRKLFYVLGLIFFAWIVYTVTTDWGGDFFTLINPILNGLVTIFLVTGVFSMIFYGRSGIIKTKKILKILLGIALFLTVLTLVVGYSLYRPFLLPVIQEYLTDLSSFFMPVIISFLFFISYFIGLLLLLFQSFGLVSVMVLFQRKYFPQILENIRESSGSQEGDNFLGTAYQNFLLWIFNVPKVLDTGEITIENNVFQDNFSWEKFSRAFFLESILAVVLAIYISLNPLLLTERSLNELFALASSASYFIPVVVLPLLIFWRLKVKIPGPTADFFLFKGVRSRLLSLILTLGTILLFLRLAVRTFELGLLVSSFLFYFAGFLMNTFFITFVYFNYFENQLAKDLLDEFKRKG